MAKEHNDLTEIITQVLNEMKSEQGENFDLDKVNLAELGRRTGIPRGKLRKIKDDGFVILPHGLSGRKAGNTVLTGYTGVIDDLLRKGITNSSVCYDRIKELGYTGGRTTVKNYISEHKDLVPAKRETVARQGSRGQRYNTDPGEAYQMDWGFVEVDDYNGRKYRVACFAMICHCCGKRYVEFFPNARQENLFIGMLHAFHRMGVPHHILTDNMKSVVVRRDDQGHPIWQRDYELFMNNIGFETKLCKPRHPFTKGAVERLIKFVKGNFLAGRVFNEITDLNYSALKWCDQENSAYHQCVDCIPDDKHAMMCLKEASPLEEGPELALYLCPERKISFDGFVNYEGRRFGVPYWYTEKTCRVRRDGYILYIYDTEMTKILTTHDVTWGRKDSFCRDQYATSQPEEKPTMPVTSRIFQTESKEPMSEYDKFNFEKEGLWDE